MLLFFSFLKITQSYEKLYLIFLLWFDYNLKIWYIFFKYIYSVASPL